MSVRLTIEPQVSPARRGEYVDAVSLGLRDLDAVNDAEQGLAQIRRRVDRNDWDYGTAVVDDLKLPLVDLRRFGGLDHPSSIFRLSGRDGARVRLYYKDILLYTGFCSETGTTDDLFRDKTRIQTLAPETIMRQTRPSAGDIANTANLDSAIRGCFLRPAVSGLLGAPQVFAPTDTPVFVSDASPLNRVSAWDALNELLRPADMVAVFEPGMQVWVGQRGRRPDRTPVELERGEIISIVQNTGRARQFTAIETTTSADDDRPIIVEVATASQQYGRRLLEFDTDWIEPADKEGILGALLTRLVKSAREWEVQVPMSVMEQSNQALLPMDPVNLRIDADAPAFSARLGTAKFDQARFARVTSPAVFAEAYVISVRADFKRRILDLHLREDPN